MDVQLAHASHSFVLRKYVYMYKVLNVSHFSIFSNELVF